METRSAGPTTVPREDFGKWETFYRSSLSPDAAWLAVPINRVNDEDELRVRRVADPDSVIVVAYGSGATFSADGRWLAYSIGVGEDERERLQEQKKPVRSDLGLVDLRSGESVEVEEVSSFAFSADGRFLAMRRYAPEGDRDAEGVDLVVRELATGVDVNFGNVSDFGWRDDGALLAMVVDAEGMAGNGVRLYAPGTGTIRQLVSAPARFSGLTWREDAADLALFRTVEEAVDGEEAAAADAWADTAHVVLAFTGVDAPATTRSVALRPWEDDRIPEDGTTAACGRAGSSLVVWGNLRSSIPQLLTWTAASSRVGCFITNTA